MTAGQAGAVRSARAACPPWCVTDHGAEAVPGVLDSVCAGEQIMTYGWGIVGSDYVCSTPMMGPDGPAVLVCGHWFRGGFPGVRLAPQDAEQVAGLLEALAAAPPHEHAEVAAALRAAAAVASGGAR